MKRDFRTKRFAATDFLTVLFRILCKAPLRYSLLGIIVISHFFGATPSALAQNTSQPAVKLLTAPMVSIPAAMTFYGTNTTHTVTGISAPSPELAALARGLGAGTVPSATYAQNVLDYIRNNISVEFHFGLTKGGLGALIDQSGTAFDQAHLMGKLLASGNVTSTYQLGTITLNAQQFGQWTGLVYGLNQAAQTFSVDAKAACQLLADGGIPASVNGSSDCTTVSGTLSTVTMAHIWVSANGLLYDPSFKRLYLKTGVDLAAAMQCGTAAAPTCGSTLTSQLLQGATQGPLIGDYIPYNYNYQVLTGLNTNALNAQLRQNGVNLEAYIRSLNTTIQTVDLVGGGVIDTNFQSAGVPSLAYQTSSWSTWSGDIPDQFRSTLNIQYQSINTTLFADDIAGNRIWMGNGILWVEHTQISGVSCRPSCGLMVTITATHPYAALGGTYGTDKVNFDISSRFVPYSMLGFPIAILQFWGKSSPSTAAHFSLAQQADPTSSADVFTNQLNGYADAVPPCGDGCGASGPTYASEFVRQQSQLASLLEPISQSMIAPHHNIGVALLDGLAIGPSAPPVAEAFSVHTSISINPAQSSGISVVPIHSAYASLSAMTEGSVIQQSKDGNDSENTASIFSRDAKNATFIFVPPGGLQYLNDYTFHNIGFKSYIFNYSLINLDNLKYYSNAGYSIILPVTWDGGTYYYNNSVIAEMVNDQRKGGGSSLDANPVESALGTVDVSNWKSHLNQKADVNPGDGSYVITPAPDLVIGSGAFPSSLSFQRYYVSGVPTRESVYKSGGYAALLGPQSWTYTGPDQDVFARMGGGWTYNFAISLRVESDIDAFVGQNSGLQAVGAITGIYGLYQTALTDSFASRMAQQFEVNWIAGQLEGGAVLYTRGPSSETFVQLPSGRYAGPANSQDTLSRTGQRTPVVYSYDYANVIFNIKGANGDVITFIPSYYWNFYIPNSGGGLYSPEIPHYTGQFVASTWSFPNGLNVSLNYTKDSIKFERTELILASVSNNLGHKLSLTTQTTYQQPFAPSQWHPSSGQDIGSIIQMISDESGRTVKFNWSNCPNFSIPVPESTPSTATFVCNNLSVSGPDGAVTHYSYAASSASPDPSALIRPEYHLRQWFAPVNTTIPVGTVVYDSLFHVQSIIDARNDATNYFTSSVFGSEWNNKAFVIDPLQNVTTLLYDRWQNLISATDPLGRSTTYSYDGAHRKSSETFPLGNSTSYTYDVRSNLLSTTQYPVPGVGCGPPNGSGPTAGTCTPIVTSTAYQEGSNVWFCANSVICNLPLSQTDANGNVTNYSFQPNTGQVTKILKPADLNNNRPETDYFYQQIPGTDSGLISFLSQKTVKQFPTPDQVTTFTYNTSNHFVLQTATVDPGGLNLRSCFKFDAIGNLVSSTDPRAGACP